MYRLHFMVSCHLRNPFCNFCTLWSSFATNFVVTRWFNHTVRPKCCVHLGRVMFAVFIRVTLAFALSIRSFAFPNSIEMVVCCLFP